MESMDTDDHQKKDAGSSTATTASSTNNNNSSTAACSQQTNPPTKIKKKPGRKPNPASPALRKAQNRAAQRAFRERKERHLRELETTIKQVQEQRDKLYRENEQLKVDNDTLRSENWYLKGIVLSLQLVCYQHNLVIPQHSPYINDQALSVLAQSIPEPIASYLDVNAKNKFPTTFHKLGNNRNSRDRYVSSGSIIVTEDGVRSVSSDNQQQLYFRGGGGGGGGGGGSSTADARISIPDLTPVSPSSSSPSALDDIPAPPHPIMLSPEPLTSNLAAIQTLRLRLRLQAAVFRTKSLPFAIQPTLLQLTVPHDPRIDLIPTSHMRDRMILFRDQFDLDECFQCLLSGSVFHGGDPAVAANWELPPEFFKKFWFLTIDFSLQRTTNRWRRLQGLKEIDQSYPVTTDVDCPSLEPVTVAPAPNPTNAQPSFDMDNLSALLSMDLNAATTSSDMTSSNHNNNNSNNINISDPPPPSSPPPHIFSSASQSSYPSSLASTSSSSNFSNNRPSSVSTSSTTPVVDKDAMFSPTPIQLTNGYLRPPVADKINSSKPSWAQHPTWDAYHQQQQFPYDSGQNRYHFG